MKILFAMLLLGAAACGPAETGRSGVDPAEGPQRAVPADIPVPDGPVRTRDLFTVVDDGQGPEVCLGGVSDSRPPVCSGPSLVDWDWAEHTVHEQARGVRWGSFMVTGTFDGESVTVTDAVPAALYDPMAPSEEQDGCGSEPCPALTDAELQRIRDGLRDLPGMLSVEGDRAPVTVHVVHDDGSLQEWAEAAYGEGAVRVISMLVPSEGTSGAELPEG